MVCPGQCVPKLWCSSGCWRGLTCATPGEPSEFALNGSLDAAVDTMKTLQAWSDVTPPISATWPCMASRFLLSVRYDDWIDLNDENEAKNWARYWRPEIQGYIHAYRTVTGVDLTSTDTVDSTIPAVDPRKRLALQQARRPCRTSLRALSRAAPS